MKNLLSKIELDQKKLVLVAVICAAILYIDYKFILQSQLQSIKALGISIAQLKADMNTLNQELANMQNSKRSLTALVAKAKTIITEDQVQFLFKEISDLANKNSVKIMQMRPVPVQEAALGAGLQGKFTPVLFSLDLTCGYHALGKFINALENAEQFMAVEELSISSNPNDYLKEQATLIVRTCVKK